MSYVDIFNAALLGISVGFLSAVVATFVVGSIDGE